MRNSLLHSLHTCFMLCISNARLVAYCVNCMVTSFNILPSAFGNWRANELCTIWATCATSWLGSKGSTAWTELGFHTNSHPARFRKQLARSIHRMSTFAMIGLYVLSILEMEFTSCAILSSRSKAICGIRRPPRPETAPQDDRATAIASRGGQCWPPRCAAERAMERCM